MDVVRVNSRVKNIQLCYVDNGRRFFMVCDLQYPGDADVIVVHFRMMYQDC